MADIQRHTKLNLSFGYSETFGGMQSINGVPNGLETAEQQVRFEVQSFVTDRLQLVGELTRDLHVTEGFHQTIGVNARILFVL